jgi:hypothetical protein
MMKHNSARKNSSNEEMVKYGVKQVYGSGRRNSGRGLWNSEKLRQKIIDREINIDRCLWDREMKL